MEDPNTIVNQNCCILKNNKMFDPEAIHSALKSIQGAIVPKIDMLQNINNKEELSKQKHACNQIIIKNFELLIESLFTAMVMLQ